MTSERSKATVLTAMDEALRLDYLDAMGIAQYVARWSLPGACPSPVIEPIPDSTETAANSLTPATTATTVSAPTTRATAIEKPARMADLLVSTPARAATASKPTPVTAAATANANEPSAASFQCQLALWTAGDLLVIADMPRLDNAQQNLLRNILQAIGRPDALGTLRQYTWPQGRDRSLHAAREHFQGMLDGGLLQKNLRQVLCFGSAAATLLVAGGNPEPATQYKDWPVISVCALHEMLAQPARKADTWRTLQVLVPA